MDVFEAMEQRQSCRAFDPDRPVEREKLERCVAAACGAPSACNSQPWHIHVVTDPALLAAVRPGVRKLGSNRFAEDAPVLIFLTEEDDAIKPILRKSLIARKFPPFDCGLAACQLVLAAEAQGLGTCFLGMLVDEKVRAALGIAEGTEIRVAIAMGYAVAGDAHRERVRRPVAESVTYY